MALTYVCGVEIELGDQVRYEGTLGRIELVVQGPPYDEPSLDWFLRELGPGVMVVEPTVFGRVYVTDASHLEFVSRGQ